MSEQSIQLSTLDQVKVRLDARGREYVSTTLEDASTPAGKTNSVTALQYYDERGDDILLLVVGDIVSMPLFRGFTLASSDSLARIPVHVTGAAIIAAQAAAESFGVELTAGEAQLVLQAAREADGGILP